MPLLHCSVCITLTFGHFGPALLRVRTLHEPILIVVLGHCVGSVSLGPFRKFLLLSVVIDSVRLGDWTYAPVTEGLDLARVLVMCCMERTHGSDPTPEAA